MEVYRNGMLRVDGRYPFDAYHVVEFDAPHPGNELYRYHVNMVKDFLSDIGEVEK